MGVDLTPLERDVLAIRQSGWRLYGRPTSTRKTAELLSLNRATVQTALRSMAQKGVDHAAPPGTEVA